MRTIKVLGSATNPIVVARDGATIRVLELDLAARPYFAHSSLSSFPEVRPGFFGAIGTRVLPAELEAMRGGSDERIVAVADFLAAQALEVLRLAREAFPGERIVPSSSLHAEALVASDHALPGHRSPANVGTRNFPTDPIHDKRIPRASRALLAGWRS